MIPPTSIDGTDITGATIDGTDVTEITVDGDTVFSAQTLPVAYSNLIAWYPFDSAEYGGSNADDVTAIIGGSGDDTAYNGNVSGASYQSSGGVTDINAGATSGAFDFDGSDDFINLDQSGLDTVIKNTSSLTTMAWASVDTTDVRQNVFDIGSTRFTLGYNMRGSGGWNCALNAPNIINFRIDSGITTTNTYFHLCLTWDGSNVEFYLDGVSQGTGSLPDVLPDGFVEIGARKSGVDEFNGLIDDVRVYDTDLTATQIADIYDNTEP